MKLIVAVNKLGYIGLDGKLPWGHCKDDLNHFKELTINSKLLVGSTTYNTLPKLKDREILVVGKDFLSLDKALSLNPDWLIGGGKMYNTLANLCDEWHISIIDNETIGDVKLELPEPTQDIKIFYYSFKP